MLYEYNSTKYHHFILKHSFYKAVLQSNDQGISSQKSTKFLPSFMGKFQILDTTACFCRVCPEQQDTKSVMCNLTSSAFAIGS